MKIAIIDVGSNSVRKQVFSDGKILLRQVINCRLALEMRGNKLADKSINRTFEALDSLILSELKQGVKCLAFATACVRNSINGNDFRQAFFNRYGFKLDVLSGEKEAEIGTLGALSGKDGTVIDVGGASSEIATAQNGKIVFARSMQDGAVTLTDAFKRDKIAAEEYLKKAYDYFSGVIVDKNAYAIGGTANTLAFIGCNLVEYDALKSDGYVLTIDELERNVDCFYSLSPKTIREQFYVEDKRAEIIHSGALILLTLLRVVNVDKIVLTENDNLYGYYLNKIEGKGYEK